MADRITNENVAVYDQGYPIADIKVEATINWNELGRAFMRESNVEQADFLLGWEQESRALGYLDESMQYGYIRQEFQDSDLRQRVASRLRDLADHLTWMGDHE